MKRGGQWERVDFEGLELALPMPDEDMVALDEAMDQLARVDACATEVVKLCFFAGLTHEQAAHELGVSLSTVERRWTFARAWLFRQLRKPRNEAP
ncbi:MAG: ECF-type sigma factor [Verrucomicrobiota bacterium]